MTFSDFPYPKDVPLFPTHDKIKMYLENYAEDIRDHIEFNSEVVMATKGTKNYQRSQWRVVINNIDAHVPPEYFDAVVVATGTFDKFCMPPEYGLESWEKENPETVIHAKDFRRPQDFEGKKVLIIGGGSSYFDIGRRMTPHVKGKLLVSMREPQLLGQMSSPDHRNVSIPKTLFPKTRSVLFMDDSIEKDIDIIMLCTGYQYEFPFLPKVEIADDGQRVANLWEHMFWIPDTTLSFVGLPKMSAIFTVVEAQSAYIARVLAGRLRTPYQSTMQQKTDEELNNRIAGAVDKKTAAKQFHNLPNPKDKDYINRLSEACIDVDVMEKRGKQPPLFDAYLDWTRKNGGAMRTEFFKQKDKHKFATPESLGFKYVPDS
ncbi:hypothetical protein BDZ45DRAFT_731566 [Acephala macrosclerotiorum]|nr:hypothetical protein BDZ45DRAFT_731566 [Acephala macrosclerotiorum]